MEPNRVVIKLRGTALLLVDDIDLVRLKNVSINYNSVYNRATVYDAVLRKSYQLGRYLLDITEPSLVVDHIDGNALNNCRSNLRVCTQRENIRNQRLQINKKSGLPKGVSIDRRRGKFVAQIRIEKRQIFLGYFTAISEAEEAYKKAAEKYFGIFASHTSRPE